MQRMQYQKSVNPGNRDAAFSADAKRSFTGTASIPGPPIPEKWVQVAGLRFYSPEIGRWVSRDPIGERGGINLIRFCRNVPVVHTDSLGKELTNDSEVVAEWVREYLESDEFSSKCEKTSADHVPAHNAEYRFRSSKKDACKVRFGVACCGKGRYGRHSWVGSRPGRIQICANNVRARGKTFVMEVIKHETQHAWDRCTGWPGLRDLKTECGFCLCKELRARYCSGHDKCTGAGATIESCLKSAADSCVGSGKACGNKAEFGSKREDYLEEVRNSCGSSYKQNCWVNTTK